MPDAKNPLETLAGPLAAEYTAALARIGELERRVRALQMPASSMPDIGAWAAEVRRGCARARKVALKDRSHDALGIIAKLETQAEYLQALAEDGGAQ